MIRRDVLKLSVAAAASSLALPARAQKQCDSDGTPAQFIPKRAPDAKAFESDIAKYPKCPYCGMDRRQYHHSRMLIQYSDDLPDAVCSLHCAAISLSLNIDREPKAVWVGDNATAAEVKTLVEVDQAVFLMGSSLPGVMTARSKVAYGNRDAAKIAQASHGGELVDFEQALLAAYTDMARDVARIRRNRAERRKRAMEQKSP
jgi:nitrous oxide reductase accessory protein NosL